MHAQFVVHDTIGGRLADTRGAHWVVERLGCAPDVVLQCLVGDLIIGASTEARK
jgi:hypothetical protein